MKIPEDVVRTIENALQHGKRIELHVEYPFIPETTKRDTTRPQIAIVEVSKTLVAKRPLN